MNNAVYEKLREIARKNKTITYSELVLSCGLGLDMAQIKDRNDLSTMLREVNAWEVENKRPMLGAVAVLKRAKPLSPGDGFYVCAEELGVRREDEKDDQLFFARMLGECFNYWKSH